MQVAEGILGTGGESSTAEEGDRLWRWMRGYQVSLNNSQADRKSSVNREGRRQGAVALKIGGPDVPLDVGNSFSGARTETW